MKVQGSSTLAEDLTEQERGKFRIERPKTQINKTFQSIFQTALVKTEQ
jgi:hypothetical protein